MRRNLSLVVLASATTIALAFPRVPSAIGQGSGSGRASAVAQSTLTPEQAEILGHLEIVYLDDGQGGLAKTLRVNGVNVQIVNGLGATNGDPSDPDSLLGVTNGTGNLIVGYSEPGTGQINRTGSHNLVLGTGNSYESFGGAVTGVRNRSEVAHASVLASSDGTASAPFSVVLGGFLNQATGEGSVVAGGFFNAATGRMSSVSGGTRCIASGDFASVTGGYKSVAAGSAASVQGGANNQALGNFSSVTGGNGHAVNDDYDWAAGTLFENE